MSARGCSVRRDRPRIAPATSRPLGSVPAGGIGGLRRSLLFANGLSVEVLIPARDDLHARNAKGMEGNRIEGIGAHRAGINLLTLYQLRQILSKDIGEGNAAPAIAHGISDARREPPDMWKIIPGYGDLARPAIPQPNVSD